MIEIRSIAASDESAWRALWREYLRFYDTELDPEIYATSFARLIDPEAVDYHGLIAVEGDAPVGLAHYIFHRHGWQAEDVCYLQDLFVTQDRRGSGTGRRLMGAVFAAADAAGKGNVYWLTQSFNAPARRLYDRVGVATPFIKYRR